MGDIFLRHKPKGTSSSLLAAGLGSTLGSKLLCTLTQGSHGGECTHPRRDNESPGNMHFLPPAPQNPHCLTQPPGLAWLEGTEWAVRHLLANKSQADW